MTYYCYERQNGRIVQTGDTIRVQTMPTDYKYLLGKDSSGYYLVTAQDTLIKAGYIDNMHTLYTHNQADNDYASVIYRRYLVR